jgi:hypothetical protein
MCHDRITGYADGLDMWYGIRSAWWDLAAAQGLPVRNFCQRVAVANPPHQKSRQLRLADQAAERVRQLTLPDGLDMYYDTREAWFDPVLAAQPNGFCRVAREANPYYRRRVLDELARIAGASRLHEMTVGTQRAHPTLALSGTRRAPCNALPLPGGVLGELARIVAESGRLNRQT